MYLRIISRLSLMLYTQVYAMTVHEYLLTAGNSRPESLI